MTAPRRSRSTDASVAEELRGIPVSAEEPVPAAPEKTITLEPDATPAPEPEDQDPPVDDGLITVRTSMRPDEDLRVTPAEHLDLEAQGLLVQSEKADARLRPQSGKE